MERSKAMSLQVHFQGIFGERIKTHRRELHLTQLELSGRLHISRTMLANIETGTQRTSVFLLARLAQTLKISTEGLVPGMTEVEARLKQSRKVSLSTETRPTLLSNELEALNISVDSGSTLEGILKEVQNQHSKLESTKTENNHDD